MVMDVSRSAVYEPGVCNIDPRGRAVRRAHGYRAAAVAAALWGIFILSHTPPVWRLTVLLPAAWSAAALLEAYSSFCVAFGVLGLFDVGGGLRRPASGPHDHSRRKDRRKAMKILAQGGAIGAAVAAVAYLTAL